MKKSILYLLTLMCLISICGCSFLHRFEIINTTDKVWKVEYEINDPRGLFKRDVTLKNCDTKKKEYLKFDDNSISFYLNPNEISYLAYATNTFYNDYRLFKMYDKTNPYQDFMNVSTITISYEDENFELDVFNLDEILAKNTMRFARIDIAKTLEYFEMNMP